LYVFVLFAQVLNWSRRTSSSLFAHASED